MASVAVPLLDGGDLERLRAALGEYTVDGVHGLLGPVGRAAHERGDLAGVARVIAGDDGRLATLVRLFLLGAEVPEAAARRALAPLALDAADELLARAEGGVQARVEIRPYAEAGAETDLAGQDWWVVSDLGSDVRPGPLAADHVLGIGSAGRTLAQATPRDRVARALDVGTGCGMQALHLAGHAASVTATDISRPALRMAATTAALSGRRWDLRQGSLLDPVAGETYDLVVANPPFVVSPGATEHEYRDSGRAGDTVCRDLVRALPEVLAPGGTAQLLANWIVPADGDWRGRVGEWLAGSGCDTWVWQREVAELGEYVTLWLRDAGHRRGTPAWDARYTAWMDWFAAHGVAAVGMGMVTIWRPETTGDDPVVVLEDVPQPVEQPCGPQFPAWIARQRWLAARDDAAVLAAAYTPDPGLVRARGELLADGGWSAARQTLRQSGGLRWEVEVDDAIAGLVAACAAGASPRLACELLAASGDDDPDTVARAVAPVLRDLIARGFLEPETTEAVP